MGSPPPISGGTLLVTFDGRTAVASDPDRDVVYGVDIGSLTLKFTIPLQQGDEPGRLAEDSAGRIHVALRGGAALVTLDPVTGVVQDRRAVCPAPRGVAWAASTDLVWVACATGELVGLPASGGAVAQSLVVGRDLRDVVVQPDGVLVVSKFRSAEVLQVSGDGQVVQVQSLPTPDACDPAAGCNGPGPQRGASSAHVAWRTIAGPLVGSTVSVYQAESTRAISTSMPGGYGAGGLQPLGSLPPNVHGSGSLISGDGGGPTVPVLFAGPIVESVVTILGPDGSPLLRPTALPQTVLPVDVALSPDGNQLAIAGAGDGFGTLPGVLLVTGNGLVSLPTTGTSPVVAVAFDGRGNVLAEALEPEAILFFVPTPSAAGNTPAGQAVGRLTLSTISNHNLGHDIFHTQAGASIACASCHPEGGDDGHVWHLDGLPRRTPSLRGTIAGTAPYHWPGDQLNMDMLIDDVYTHRMSGTQLDSWQQQALAEWVEAIPPPPAPSWVDASSAKRGEELFRTSAGCVACHSGPKLTNNATVDVGTGTDIGADADGGAPPAAFQVPPLVGVGWRTPLFHNGCATTVEARFYQCATHQHGFTSQLSPQEIEDLVAYLESL